MTSTTAASMPAPRTQVSAITRAGWVWIVVIGGLFVAWHWSYILRMILIATKAKPGQAFLPTLQDIIRTSWNPDWSHILVIPLISFYFVMRDREKLATIPRRVYLPGLAILILGMLSFLWWIYPGRNDMFQGFSMVVALFGLVLFLLGPGMMRVLWLPVLYMLLFVKVSDRIWGVVANNLQDIAAICSTFVLQMLGLLLDFDVSRTGNHLTLGFSEGGTWVTKPLAIAEACSGLRMMMTFIALGVAMAFIGQRTWWQRVIMMGMTVPIAIGVNVGRVVLLGLVMMVNEEMTKGDFHTFLGMLMLIPAALLFMLLGWILDRLVIHDEPAGGPSKLGAAKTLTDSSLTTANYPLFAAIGGLTGIVLAVLVGVNYFLLYMALRPFEFEQVGANTARILLAGGVVLLIAAGVGSWRLLRNSDRNGRRGTANTMALGAAAGVLLTGVLGFEAIASINQVVLIKDPVPLRQRLFKLDADFGSWEMIHEDPPLTAEEMQYLKTDDYISYHFRDVTWPDDTPGQLIRLHLAYYTGTVDTVPHVPDRCMTAGGAIMEGLTLPTVHLDPAHFEKLEDGRVRAHSVLADAKVIMPGLDIDTTLFRYRIPGDDRVFSVLYFFVANDQYFATPDGVRLNGFNPTDRYSYYCKVEVNLGPIGTGKQATERAAQFLNTMLPEIMACLPDWQEVNARSTERNSHGSTRTPALSLEERGSLTPSQDQEK